ncbi:hypothetical protein REIP_1496 [Rickettsia endosymbiont of Ixodes pacificus]|nr:hypothetical protein REIP_1496 [Rickettsia endosymbiont of Ixodes pacificus]
MKDCIKKIAFVFSGLFIITGTFVLYSIENVNAQRHQKSTELGL